MAELVKPNATLVVRSYTVEPGTVKVTVRSVGHVQIAPDEQAKILQCAAEQVGRAENLDEEQERQ